LRVIDDHRAKIGQVGDSRDIDVEVNALLDRPRLGHLVNPKRVLRNIVNQLETSATRLGASAERRGPEGREHLRIDGVNAEILEADRIRCSHDPTLTDVIIFSWI
jgi:hypothetical protein